MCEIADRIRNEGIEEGRLRGMVDASMEFHGAVCHLRNIRP